MIDQNIFDNRKLMHSHVALLSRSPFREPLELAVEWLSDRELSMLIETCSRWHSAELSWHWQVRALLLADDEPPESRHCCGRGLFLALTYSPQRQLVREKERLRKNVNLTRKEWQIEELPYVQKLRKARRRLSGVALSLAWLLLKTANGSDAMIVLFWPCSFVWHASSIPRLAHDPLAGHWRSTFPISHFVGHPDALDMRRYFFATALAVLAVAFALLLFWWNCLWYALGNCMSEMGFSDFDVAHFELELKELKRKSTLFQNYCSALEEEKHLSSKKLKNPYSLQRRRAKPLKTWLFFRRSKRKMSSLTVAAELNRPLLRVLGIASCFLVAALFMVVLATEKNSTVEIIALYLLRASLILMAAVRKDIFPVFRVFLKIATALISTLLSQLSRHNLLFPLFLLLLFFFFAATTESPPPKTFHHHRKKKQQLAPPVETT